MRDFTKMGIRRHRGHYCRAATLLLALSTYIEQVVSFPMDANNQWPTFPRRNIGALAREGFLRSAAHDGYKRSISTLAKNGQLPTFRSPYDESVKQGQDDETHDKRNLASIARLRSYAAMKRNIQALARDGYPVGRRINQQNEKRSAPYALPSMERMDDTSDDYYNNYYQSPASMDSDAIDANDVYDFQQSVNPFMFPPMSQVYKRNGFLPPPEYQIVNHSDLYDYFKRGSMGLPVLGMYRPNYLETNRNKRYIMSMPDPVDNNDIDSPEIDPANSDKRSVGSIPLTRISELGNISLIPKLTQAIQTTPTYRRRQYLLTRTRPGESSTER